MLNSSGRGTSRWVVHLLLLFVLKQPVLYADLTFDNHHCCNSFVCHTMRRRTINKVAAEATEQKQDDDAGQPPTQPPRKSTDIGPISRPMLLFLCTGIAMSLIGQINANKVCGTSACQGSHARTPRSYTTSGSCRCTCPAHIVDQVPQRIGEQCSGIALQHRRGVCELVCMRFAHASHDAYLQTPPHTCIAGVPGSSCMHWLS